MIEGHKQSVRHGSRMEVKILVCLEDPSYWIVSLEMEKLKSHPRGVASSMVLLFMVHLILRFSH